MSIFVIHTEFMYAKDVVDLKIYEIALQLSTEIVAILHHIPHYWNIPECGQIMRSSSSVHANIAEGFTQRFYKKKFIHYLYIAMGSSDETGNHLRKLVLDHHLAEDRGLELMKKYKNLSVRILNFINYLKKNK